MPPAGLELLLRLLEGLLLGNGGTGQGWDLVLGYHMPQMYRAHPPAQSAVNIRSFIHPECTQTLFPVVFRPLACPKALSYFRKVHRKYNRRSDGPKETQFQSISSPIRVSPKAGHSLRLRPLRGCPTPQTELLCVCVFIYMCCYARAGMSRVT